MSWARSRPNGGKVDPKYRTPEHRAQVNAYKQQLAQQGHLICAQPHCLHRSRLILPGMAWAAGHDHTGTTYIGPVHRKCNVVDGAKRARAKQDRPHPHRTPGFTRTDW